MYTVGNLHRYFSFRRFSQCYSKNLKKVDEVASDDFAS